MSPNRPYAGAPGIPLNSCSIAHPMPPTPAPLPTVQSSRICPPSLLTFPVRDVGWLPWDETTDALLVPTTYTWMNRRRQNNRDNPLSLSAAGLLAACMPSRPEVVSSRLPLPAARDSPPLLIELLLPDRSRPFFTFHTHAPPNPRALKAPRSSVINIVSFQFAWGTPTHIFTGSWDTEKIWTPI
ncbi:hypothetical protein D9619_013657 [Psilocybe cf. subviscida]|uniref:Uncharacterized protein n=1 Tax=Psilocybe cf. subviscida TaxID=2480587 RepID=A0A8H5BTH3_9AGAR|nr:hypothetical protein D9619_013657 [Psilocybe cf. subviscida]